MTSSLDFWDRKHRKYNTQTWIHEPNYFAEESADRVQSGQRLLDLGCGQGQDALYFARRGAVVTAADFSGFALAQFEAEAKDAGIDQVVLDLSETPYPFADASYDVVYAHLSLHYFSDALTLRVFAEVARVLRIAGLFLATFNSVRDDEFGTGRSLESHYFELEPGDRKRFFDADQVRHFANGLFRVDEASFGQGTRKKKEDQLVRMVATRIKEGL